MFGFGKRADTQPPPAAGPELRCSFCNKSQRYVQRLIAGPNHVYICDECVDICMNIVSEGPKEEGRSLVATTSACALCHIPVDATESLYVRERGALCPGCVSEIEASLQERGTS